MALKWLGEKFKHGPQTQRNVLIGPFRNSRLRHTVLRFCSVSSYSLLYKACGSARCRPFACTHIHKPQAPFLKSWAWHDRESNPTYQIWWHVPNLLHHLARVLRCAPRSLTFAGLKSKACGHLFGPDQNRAPDEVFWSGGKLCSSCLMVLWYCSWKEKNN